MEATVSAVVPMIPTPLGQLGPFSEEERKAIVQRLKGLFPKATEDAIQSVVFGPAPRMISG